MTAQYLQLANDLRKRIAGGEWTVGEKLPTIAELQLAYGIKALNTVRAGQRVLVDEGLLEPVSGVGVFVRAVPLIDATTEDLLAELQTVVTSAERALTAVTSLRPLRVVIKQPENPVTEVWCHQQHYYCLTCERDVYAVSRGWVAVEDFYDQRVEIPHHDDHRILVYLGLSPDDDQAAALLRERWWEHRAHLQRAAAALAAADDVPAATRYALKADHLQREHPGIDALGVFLYTSDDELPSYLGSGARSPSRKVVGPCR